MVVLCCFASLIHLKHYFNHVHHYSLGFNPLPTKDVSCTSFSIYVWWILMFLFCTLFVANSAQTSSSISPGVIAGVAIVVVIGTVAVIFVVCVYIVRKSRGSIPAAHHSAPEPSSLHYPRQQGVTYHTHSGTIEKYSCRDILILSVLVMQTSNLHWL